MAIMTLLEVVQSVLSSMNSDEVTDIDDTIESTQVALIAKETYFDLTSQSEWPHQFKEDYPLDVLDPTSPHILGLPTNLHRVKEVYYLETRGSSFNYKLLDYLTPEAYLENSNRLNPDDVNVVEVLNFNNTPMFVTNNAAPKCWTIIAENSIQFDSFESSRGTFIASEDIKYLGYQAATWTRSNLAVPTISDKMFPTYLAEVKRVAHQDLRQQISPIAEEQARRGKAMGRRQASLTDASDKRAKYGRTTIQTGRR